MKERELGRVKHLNEINQLQQAINRHNAIELKRIIQEMHQRLEIAQNPERALSLMSSSRTSRAS